MEEDGEGNFGVAVRGAVGDYVEAELGGSGAVCIRPGRHGVLGGGEGALHRVTIRRCPVEWWLDAR